jgi:hypothetical protein
MLGVRGMSVSGNSGGKRNLTCEQIKKIVFIQWNVFLS